MKEALIVAGVLLVSFLVFELSKLAGYGFTKGKDYYIRRKFHGKE